MIDIEKFICSLLADHPVGVTVREDIHKALKDQGLEYKGGKIVPIEDKTALQESEDERIRKTLVAFFTDWHKTRSHCWGISVPKILAWLEKQSKHQKFRDSIQVGDKVTRNKDGILVNLSQLDRVAKQGEKGAKGNDREIPNSEPKPADKVEQKFHKGDWITNGACIIQIASVDKEFYWHDNDCVGGDIESIDKQYHLWTIQDAKDGDILSWDDSKCIALFKNIYDKDSFNSYGFVGHCTDTFESRPTYHDIEGAHPATKEQRDLLFQKMKEAGYEWDAEKKELKIIDWSKHIKYEPNSPSITKEYPTWSEEDEAESVNIIDFLNSPSTAELCPTLRNEAIAWLKALKERYTWKPSEEQMEVLNWCKPLWNEPKTKAVLETLIEDLKELKG